MRVSEILQTTRRKMQGKWSVAIGVTVMVTLITMIVPNTITPNFGTMEFWADFLWLFLVSLPLAMGSMWLFLDMHDGRDVEPRHVFDIFRDYSRVVGAVLWKYLLIFGWFLLFIIPGIIAMIRYSQMEFLMKDDPKLTGQEAINKSKEMMHRNKARYFGLYLRIFWPAILGVAVGVFMMMDAAAGGHMVGGMIYIDPDQASRAQLVSLVSVAALHLLNAYANAAFAVFYRDLKQVEEEAWNDQTFQN